MDVSKSAWPAIKGMIIRMHRSHGGADAFEINDDRPWFRGIILTTSGTYLAIHGTPVDGRNGALLDI
jgi:hypothetical protein